MTESLSFWIVVDAYDNFRKVMFCENNLTTEKEFWEFVGLSSRPRYVPDISSDGGWIVSPIIANRIKAIANKQHHRTFIKAIEARKNGKKDTL